MKTSKGKKHLLVSLTCLATLILALLLAGCAGFGPTGEMALKFDNPPASDKLNSMALFTMRLENQYQPGFKPHLAILKITSDEPEYLCNFKPDKSIANTDLPYSEYMISVFLSPGKYKLEEVSGSASNILFTGSFKFPVMTEFEIPPDATLVYCGQIIMNNRKRQEGEKRSGKVLPLLDQAASGMAGGTFDIIINDNSEDDIQLFQESFPWLRHKEIKSLIMKKIYSIPSDSSASTEN